MPDTLFESATARHSLPLLFSGQSQKEVFVNEALARIDALLHPAIENEFAIPPTSPTDGLAWLVATGASGEWTGRNGQIAVREAGNWLYFSPQDGMKLLNRATGQCLLYRGGWQAPVRPAAPSGGSTIDSEARQAISSILAVLTTCGIITAS